MLYCAYPKKCDELLSRWNNESGYYNFTSWKCKIFIKVPKVLENGDTRMDSMHQVIKNEVARL